MNAAAILAHGSQAEINAAHDSALSDHLARLKLASGWVNRIAHFVSLAEEAGFIVEVTREPVLPLAMGNHRAVVTVWQKRVAA